MTAPVPVTVVTGFLGAGKTTLVNGWLAHVSRGDVAVVVNELGAAGIDGELLAERAKTVKEITGGCVCCTTQAELVRALDDIAMHTPKRILIETSGAASPAGVLRAVASGGRERSFVLDGVITVVDATRIDTVTEQELALEQLGYADVIVLSRMDTCTPEDRTRSARLVAERNAAAVVASAGHGVVDAAQTLEDLLALRGADLPPRPEVPTHRAHAVYESLSLVLDGSVDGERFADFMEAELATIAGRLFRIKGILAVDGVAERMIVQGVGDTVAITFGARWEAARPTSRLVVVGFGLDRDALSRGFAACAATS